MKTILPKKKCVLCGNIIPIPPWSPAHVARCWGKRLFCNRTCQFSYSRGRKRALEIGKKISSSKKKNPYKHSPEIRRKISQQNIGRKHSEESKEKLRHVRYGPLNPNWRGGTKKRIIGSFYKGWRTSVFSRDNYTCQVCGAHSRVQNKVILNAHHIRRWADNIYTRFETSNGVTLCQKCHRDVHKGLLGFVYPYKPHNIIHPSHQSFDTVEVCPDCGEHWLL